ncbi:MAG: DUF4861 family protein, partial [Allomuricauda sp.]
MLSPRYWFVLILAFVLTSCLNKDKVVATVKVHNSLNMERLHETVEISAEFLGVSEPLEVFGIRDVNSKKVETIQYVDKNNDGNYDVMLFQPRMDSLSERKFEVFFNQGVSQIGTGDLRCYSRFVPERTDDYAWENNRVAFRTFGPTAQMMAEKGISGGTLTSGIDGWLKKVEYPIIDKWYEKTISKRGNYHKDTGEGLDNFHVGSSRGIGGIAIKENGHYYFSKNFASWRTVSNGPIRTSFELTYNDWHAGEKVVRETKRVSLDYGSNLTKYEIEIHGVEQISAGLTLHENDGCVTINDGKGFVSYWQPHGNSELGMAIVSPKEFYKGFEKYETTEKDLSNLYANLKVLDNQIIYYAGFGWKESGQFKTKV